MHQEIIEFDIVAIILSIISFHTFHSQKQIDTKRNAIFYVIVVFVGGSSVFSLLSSIAFNNLDTTPAALASFLNMLYLFFHTQIAFLFCIYIFVLAGYSRVKLPFRIFFILTWSVLLFLILTNPFHHALFFIADGKYKRGPLSVYPYMTSAMYILVTICMFATRYKKLTPVEFSSFFLALTFAVIGSAIQMMVPGLILESFALSLSVLVLLLIIQNDRNFIDPITGLKNDFAFNTVIKERLEQKSPFSLLLVHSRELKIVQTYLDNDSYNILLKTITTWLSDLITEKFQLFALSDNLFAIVTPRHTKHEIVGELSLDIIRRSQEPWTRNQDEIQLTFQTTILHIPVHCQTINHVHDYIGQFLNLAELYSDRHIIYSRDFIPENHARQARIAYALQERLENKHIEILYQPILSLNNNTIIALEALVYFPLTDVSVAHQSEIIRTAEYIGLGKQLSELIMKTTFSWFMEEELYKKNIFLQIRLLESFCLEANWANRILEIAEQTNMDLSFLCLQLTETTITNALNNIITNIDVLTDKDVHFALDDYGSGYTEFAEIVEIPFKTAKLDKKIVHAAFSNPIGKQLLEGSVSLFKKLKWAIVAEGIEKKEHLDYLTSIGLNYFQGYYIGYPEKGESVLYRVKNE